MKFCKLKLVSFLGCSVSHSHRIVKGNLLVLLVGEILVSYTQLS
jgi:hypothetical protein